MSKKGLYYGILAYTLWGFLPLYWHALQNVPASVILVNRILWSFVFLAILLSFRKRWAWVQTLRTDKSAILYMVLAAVLIGVNWYIYIWAVNADYVVETSLGYFINPLVNVFLGTFFLHEQLRTGQWWSVGLAGLGVLYLTAIYGSLPWIALSLAFSFGFYGLIKKKVRLGAAESLTSEMSVLLIPALLFLTYISTINQTSIELSDIRTIVLLVGSGIVTAIPLVLFAAAARRIPLTTIGLLQYIAPTIQFLIGVYIFQEPFTTQRLIGFVVIWVALALYTIEGIYHQRNRTSLSASKELS
jgi:chloramphenicol-sensitive protein RarD